MTTVKKTAPRQAFKAGEAIVYPAHGVGRITAIEEQEIAGFKLELYVVSFEKDKMVLRVPTAKAATVGMRKLAEPDLVQKALDTLTGRARVKRTMWSRRAQEYEAKINSGDLIAITEVVRDLHRSEAQPEQSYSERQLYESALDRVVREISTGEPHHRDRGPEAHRAEPRQVARAAAKGAEAEAEADGETDDLQ
jgi:CarD family transcriptional regulator